MNRRIWLVLTACVTITSCGDSSDDADSGCAIYSDFLAAEEDPSDVRAMDVLRQVERETEDDDVRRFAIALRAALEDQADITVTYQGLARACGLGSSGDP